jgi:hypothetical protein
MNLIPRILFWWGGSILCIAYAVLALGWIADAYLKSGWIGAAVVAAVVSSIPALLIGMILQSRADDKRIDRYRERP